MKLVSIKHATWAACAMFVWIAAGAWIIYASREVKPPLVPYFSGMVVLGLLLAALTFFVARTSVDKIWRLLFVMASLVTITSSLKTLLNVLQGGVELLALLKTVMWACAVVGLWVSRNEPFWKNIKRRGGPQD